MALHPYRDTPYVVVYQDRVYGVGDTPRSAWDDCDARHGTWVRETDAVAMEFDPYTHHVRSESR